MKTNWSTIVILLALTAISGCEGSRPLEPTAPAAVPAAPAVPVPTVPVQVQGRVVDGESAEPIPGAFVVARPPGGSADQTALATADDQGEFRLTMNLPADWKHVILHASSGGFDSYGGLLFGPAEVGALELRPLRIRTIRPGESIEMRAFGTPYCFMGMDEVVCRRVIVEVPSGESVDVEIISASPDRGAVLGTSQHPSSIDSVRDRRVTVTGGEVWVFPLKVEPTSVKGVFEQPVTLKAYLPNK